MKRPRTTSLVAPAPAQEQAARPEQPAEPKWRDLAPVVAALIAVLDLMEVSPKAGPAMKAHRSTIRGQGKAAAAVGGSEAMEAVLRQAVEADPAHAQRRREIIVETWTGLPEWRT